MKKELIIANLRTYEKTNEDGKKWRAQIIDGMIIGMGVIEGVFVSEDKIKTNIEIGGQYSISLKDVCKKGKLFCEIEEISVPDYTFKD